MSEGTDEILRGIAAIGAALGISERAAKHLIATGALPVFKLGGRVCCRRRTLTALIAEREAAGATGYLERRLAAGATA